MNRAHFDLNLLRVFHQVYLTRNVRRSAEALGLSQPAVSHGLRRLRLALKDALFIRVPGGVAPTAKADQFALYAEAALRTVETALVEADGFDPARSPRRFVLHMSDLGTGEFLPQLLGTMSRRAPEVRLEIQQLPGENLRAALEQGRIDLAVGYLPQLGATHRVDLFEDRYVVLLRRGHPAARRVRSHAGLARLRFVLVRGHTEPARALQQLGLDGQVRLAVPHFQVLPQILARTDLAAIVPFRPARHFASLAPLQIADAGLEIPPLQVGLHWMWRVHGDPGHRWLRETFAELFADPKPDDRHAARRQAR
jgi:DNA-binding transcriptional LysR family regulator